MANRLFETYKNYVMTHVKHMIKIASDIVMEKCVHIHHLLMLYHIGNMCFVVVRNVHRFIFQVQNQISTIESV